MFTEEKEEQDESMVIESKEANSRQRKYSSIHEKNMGTRNRLKTEKIVEKESELMGHAENFMKIIKGKNSHETTATKEFETIEDNNNKKKTYRRRKIKRLATGVEHFF